MNATGNVAAPRPAMTPLRTRDITPALGTEIFDIDLRAALSDVQFAAILDLFQTRHLLVFPNQRIDADQQGEFAQRFGTLDPVVKVEANDGSTRSAVHTVSNLNAQGVPIVDPVINANYWWHSDRAYRVKGSLVTALYGIELPPAGGDTLFANLIDAYAALPEATKKRINSLKVVHSYEFMRNTIMNLPLTDEERKKVEPATHSLVPVHPQTGEKILFVGMYASEIIGLPLAEGRALITQLQEHATQPHFVYAHKWRPGDLVVWDNRCLIHKATDDYEMGKFRRVMRRVVVQGTEVF